MTNIYAVWPTPQSRRTFNTIDQSRGLFRWIISESSYRWVVVFVPKLSWSLTYRGQLSVNVFVSELPLILPNTCCGESFLLAALVWGGGEFPCGFSFHFCVQMLSIFSCACPPLCHLWWRVSSNLLPAFYWVIFLITIEL